MEGVRGLEEGQGRLQRTWTLRDKQDNSPLTRERKRGSMHRAPRPEGARSAREGHLGGWIGGCVQRGEVGKAGLSLSQRKGSGPDQVDFRLDLFIINRVSINNNDTNNKSKHSVISEVVLSSRYMFRFILPQLLRDTYY